jgi:hypothetical protein
MKGVNYTALEHLMINLKQLQHTALKLIKYYKVELPTGLNVDLNAG